MLGTIDLPDWATDLSRLIRKAVCFGETIHVDGLEFDSSEEQIEESGPLPFDLMWREPYLLIKLLGI